MSRLLKNRTELLEALKRRIDLQAPLGDDLLILALAYLIHELVPPDRTTKHVFS